MFRVALIGYGLAGRSFHAPLIAATPGLELTAIVTRSPPRREHAAATHPGAALLEDPAEAIAGADLVVIATPNRYHAALALAALESSVAVVVDKPAATSLADAVRVRDAAAAAGVPVAVFHNRRWDGDFLTVARLLREERLGRVGRFESRFERWRPAVAGGWREAGDPAEGGGALLDLGPHLIDQALHLFGPVTRVYAEVRALRAGAEVPDDVFLALEHASGVRSHLAMGMLAGRPGPRFRVLGDRGAYVVEGLDPQEAALRAGGAPGDAGWGAVAEGGCGAFVAGDDARDVPTEPGRYQDFYAGMAATLRHGAPVPVAVDEAVAGLAVVEAAERSAVEGTVVASA